MAARSKNWILGVCLALLLLPGSAQGQVWVWKTETVDELGQYSNLAVDAEGNLHISYLNVEDGIMYGFRPAGSSKWFTMAIDGWGAYENLNTNITLDQQGNPHICYTPSVMKYARWEDGKWHIQEIAPASGLIAYTCSILLEPDGTPHMVWYQIDYRNRKDYLHLRHAVEKDGAWHVRTVDLNPETGKWNSMVLDGEGNVHLSYSAYSIGLKHARWNGEKWAVSLVDARDNFNTRYRGMGNALVLTKEGNAQISYFQEFTLKYARREGDTWSTEPVDMVSPAVGIGWSAYRSTQVLDRQEFPHIVYGDIGQLKHAYWDGTQWHIQVIAVGGGDQYQHSAIARDSEDRLFVSYRDPVDGSLKVAVGFPEGDRQTVAAQENGNE